MRDYRELPEGGQPQVVPYLRRRHGRGDEDHDVTVLNLSDEALALHVGEDGLVEVGSSSGAEQETLQRLVVVAQPGGTARLPLRHIHARASVFAKKHRQPDRNSARVVATDQGSVLLLQRPTASGQHCLLLPARDMSRWMAEVPDTRSVGELFIPGTHETLALHGGPIAKCQSTSVTQQLNGGIRFFDLRFALNRFGVIEAYHGFMPQQVTCTEVLRQLSEWLEEHPTECLLLKVRQEDQESRSQEPFEDAFWPLVLSNKDRWYLGPSWPTLGQARGRLILLNKFLSHEKGGIFYEAWWNNRHEPWQMKIGGRQCLVQDWYNIHTPHNIPRKVNHVLALLYDTKPPSTTTFNFASASGFPAAFPELVARGSRFGTPFSFKGINELVRDGIWDWLAKRARRVAAKREGGMILVFDFCEEPAGLVPLFVEGNFR